LNILLLLGYSFAFTRQTCVDLALVHQGVNKGKVTKPPSASSGCGLAYPSASSGYD